MNPLDNPFAPGAGVPPPELAGRDQLIESIHVSSERSRRSLAARSVLLLGLRGVGKTVLLDRVHRDAQGAGLATVMIEATERSALPALLAAELHGVLLRLSRRQRMRDVASRALRALAGFASALKVKYGDVERASAEVAASLDTGFFRARFDRLTPSQKRYLRAMAELGPGPHRSGAIARVLGRKVTALAPTRGQLIAKGMVWSATRGDTAFTVPLFDRFMRRIMPGAA